MTIKSRKRLINASFQQRRLVDPIVKEVVTAQAKPFERAVEPAKNRDMHYPCTENLGPMRCGSLPAARTLTSPSMNACLPYIPMSGIVGPFSD